jgi:RND family efflux transporter MFP subunit
MWNTHMATMTINWWQRVRGSVGLFILVPLVACLTMACPLSPPKSRPDEAGATGTRVIEVPGRTQCILSRKCSIAPVPLHPVIQALVEPGSRVKKGQVLVKMDDDEAQADVRSKQALLESAKIGLKEARRYLAAAEEYVQKGALPEQRYHEIRVAALKAEQDERVAEAALDASKAELEHYQVTAQIEGVISSLDVHAGMVSRPGTTTWGEILDLREVNVRCELTLEQVNGLALGQSAEVRKSRTKEMFGIGRVVFVGIAVNKNNGLVPVLVRIPNEVERLRCGELVHVRLR